MICAIVGSREFPAEHLVRYYVGGLPAGTTVLSGGARGVDSWAVDEARKHGLTTIVIPADWDRHGRGAGFIRNAEIVRQCDWLICFWDGKSRGAADTIRRAQHSGVPHAIIQPDHNTGSWDIQSTEDKLTNLYLYIDPEKETRH